MFDRPALRPAALLALCGALLLALALALPAPAQAHDSLLSTDPEDGATLETSPEELTFTFSGELLDVSPLVRITDESGEELAEITPTIDGAVATAALPEPLPAGTHTVQWRVVSGDGHPIEGTVTLTVEQGAQSAEPGGDDSSAASEDEASSEPSAQSSDEPAETTADGATAEEDSESSAGQTGLGVGTLVIVLAVVVLGAGGAAFAILRRRD
ncbi:copper resistance CopC family protein [Brachybacterium saurashtrense]|uniref:Copper resistance protein CopC n=1 Tax=Brachybacterium saurashtrense TaxID=556288 RepID=A0A345YPK5_9MICO|nr:copper resistance CopC family protein [Brachybacterium saurashtrense]AXK45857.1 copper resistance protein CopC [Brachybacterium saurashtrense]RRR24876.1 copper resistance protein CopC [Brachybacterium saurashtrense]